MKENSQNKKLVFLVVGFIGLIGALGLLFLPMILGNNGQTTEVTDNRLPQEESVMADKTKASVNEVKIVNVEGGAYYFKPNEIRVAKGQTVKIVFTNAGGMHDLTIDEFNVKTKTTQTGETTVVEFVADQAGEFEFYCSINNHRQLGMVGTLVVK